MGSDLSHQQVIAKSNNVLLEEISGFYYLTAFWKLLNERQEAHFIAATGANNIEPLANMFLGWGLDFIVALDDDPRGRDVYRKLKVNFCGDREELVQARVYKIKPGPGIEDVFSKPDFARFVLDEPAVTYAESNSAYVKKNEISKPVLAFQFLIAVREGKIAVGAFEQDTTSRMRDVVKAVADRLRARTQQ